MKYAAMPIIAREAAMIATGRLSDKDTTGFPFSETITIDFRCFLAAFGLPCPPEPGASGFEAPRGSDL